MYQIGCQKFLGIVFIQGANYQWLCHQWELLVESKSFGLSRTAANNDFPVPSLGGSQLLNHGSQQVRIAGIVNSDAGGLVAIEQMKPT
jgi:hypothetical protein